MFKMRRRGGRGEGGGERGRRTLAGAGTAGHRERGGGIVCIPKRGQEEGGPGTPHSHGVPKAPRRQMGVQ